MERKKFIIAGAEFSAPQPVGTAIYARLKENVYEDLKALGATDKDAQDESAWLHWLKMLLEKKPMIASYHILQSLLRPESGVSVLDAFESDTKGAVGEPLIFFTESMKALLPAGIKSIPGSPSSLRPKAKRKR